LIYLSSCLDLLTQTELELKKNVGLALPNPQPYKNDIGKFTTRQAFFHSLDKFVYRPYNEITSLLKMSGEQDQEQSFSPSVSSKVNVRPVISSLSVRSQIHSPGVGLRMCTDADIDAPGTRYTHMPGPSHTTRWPCVLELHTQSISTTTWNVLRFATGTAQVLGHFRRAVDLLIDEAVIALVLPEIGNGPFNVVVTNLPDGPLPRHSNLAWTSNVLHIGLWQIHFDAETQWWNPCPPWDTLTLNPSRLAQLRDIAIREAHTRAPIDSPFIRLLLGDSLPIVTALGRALAANNVDAIGGAAAAIAGLGPGLTPSGDDFLAGAMMGMRMGNRKWEMANGDSTDHASRVLPLASGLFAAAAPRTTHLSRAFLHAASKGLADERWHNLLVALSAENPAQLERSATSVLNFGASSGLDMVAGFLWQLKALSFGIDDDN
jgi:hypothetical protein